jgi:hypothetical protein
MQREGGEAGTVRGPPPGPAPPPQPPQIALAQQFKQVPPDPAICRRGRCKMRDLTTQCRVRVTGHLRLPRCNRGQRAGHTGSVHAHRCVSGMHLAGPARPGAQGRWRLLCTLRALRAPTSRSDYAGSSLLRFSTTFGHACAHSWFTVSNARTPIGHLHGARQCGHTAANMWTRLWTCVRGCGGRDAQHWLTESSQCHKLHWRGCARSTRARRQRTAFLS